MEVAVRNVISSVNLDRLKKKEDVEFVLKNLDVMLVINYKITNVLKSLDHVL